jgi:hypothetical protein
MPALQLMAERANATFNRSNVGRIAPTVFDNRSFGEIATDLGIAKTSIEREYLDMWPASLQEGIKAIIRSAIVRENPLPVTICWAPGYDFEMLVAESKSIPGSLGGITIFLRSRYPNDHSSTV